MRSREREKEKPDLLEANIVEAVEPAVVAPVAVATPVFSAAPDLAHLSASPDLALKSLLLNPPLKAAIAAIVAALVVEHCTGCKTRGMGTVVRSFGTISNGHICFSGLLLCPESERRCSMQHLKTGSGGNLRASTMKSRQLTQQRWIFR
ncbi:hypothetical protein LWI28_028682 [Acer negundo]|uniref:Uncharacterized protein n=1 Tax=Acer negundo TaxID=4023 RepID=A0AAD5NR01_ACENE|nr:hypothetical protein LWI28_028682 [Acer negundo]